MTAPQWAKDYCEKDLYASGVSPEIRAWIHESTNWMKNFLFRQMNALTVHTHIGFCEWSIFALIGDQWWYFSSGDCRFKVMTSLLVRTANSPSDYTGGKNQYVSYADPDFEQSLENLLRGRRMNDGIPHYYVPSVRD